MKYFLAKTDPETYSVDDFEKEKKTTWNGVRNALAVMTIKRMQEGDRVLIYHSQGEGSIRGLAEVVGKNRMDFTDERSWLVDFKFIRKFSEPYVTIKDVKASGLFPDFALVRHSRLSTMEVPAQFISWLKKKGLQV
jgi:predicted RNA-binding protein with PUA-like domain